MSSRNSPRSSAEHDTEEKVTKIKDTLDDVMMTLFVDNGNQVEQGKNSIDNDRPQVETSDLQRQKNGFEEAGVSQPDTVSGATAVTALQGEADSTPVELGSYESIDKIVGGERKQLSSSVEEMEDNPSDESDVPADYLKGSQEPFDDTNVKSYEELVGRIDTLLTGLSSYNLNDDDKQNSRSGVSSGGEGEGPTSGLSTVDEPSNYVTDIDSLSNSSPNSGAYSSSLFEGSDEDPLEQKHSPYRGVVDLLQTPNEPMHSTDSRSDASSTFYVDKSIGHNSFQQLESPSMSRSATDFPGVDMPSMLKYSHVKGLDQFDCDDDVEEGVPLHGSNDVRDYDTDMKYQVEPSYHDINKGRKSRRSGKATIEVVRRRKHCFIGFSFLVFLLSASILGLSMVQSVQRRHHAGEPTDAVVTGQLNSDEGEIESQQHAESEEPEFTIGYEGEVVSLIIENNSTSAPTQSPTRSPVAAVEKESAEEIIEEINAIEDQLPDLNMTDSEKELQDQIVSGLEELAEAIIASEKEPANEDQESDEQPSTLEGPGLENEEADKEEPVPGTDAGSSVQTDDGSPEDGPDATEIAEEGEENSSTAEIAACQFCPAGLIEPNLQLPGGKDTPTCLMVSETVKSLSSDDRLCSIMQESQATCCPDTWAQIQEQTCMAFGLPCPDDEKSCCSGKCEKDKETKEKVCAAPKNNDKGNGGGLGEAEGICLDSGEECPEDEGQCCSGKCQKNKDTKEMECK